MQPSNTQSAPPGYHTRSEIFSQPDAWLAALDGVAQRSAEIQAFFAPDRFDTFLLTGCGSSYYLAQAIASVWQELTTLPAQGLPASELWLTPASAYAAARRRLLLIASRSGETTEALRAYQEFTANGRGDVLTLTCYPDSALAQMGDLRLVVSSGQEESVAQTRSFSSLYMTGLAIMLCARNSQQRLAELRLVAEAARQMLGRYADLARTVGADLSLDRFYFLGSGARHGLAREVSLKMKEMSLTHSEPFHFLEFRHGPMAMLTPSTLVVGLVSEQNRKQELAVLDEMRRQGARILALGEAGLDVNFNSAVDELLRNALYLPILQLMGLERSLSKGLNPDRPENLVAYIRLDE